jgi:predicted RNase H-like HicB family nuclease
MVVVERGETSWGAHIPDLPGCVAVGESRDEVLQLIREAIEFHIEGLRQDGLPVPRRPPRGSSLRFGPPDPAFSRRPTAAADAGVRRLAARFG